jgi:hypothetical protein
MNKYNIWYNSLIDQARNRSWTKNSAPCYTESHHIIPKSLGGSNSKENLVLLTAREHYIAHLLLCKFGDSNQKSKMIWAMQRFLTSNKTVSSSLYSNIRNKWIEEHKKKLIGNTRRLGKKDTEETKLKKSLSMKGKVGKWTRTEMHCFQIAERNSVLLKENNPMHNLESRNKVSASKIGRKRIYREDGSFYMSKVNNVYS